MVHNLHISIICSAHVARLQKTGMHRVLADLYKESWFASANLWVSCLGFYEVTSMVRVIS